MYVHQYKHCKFKIFRFFNCEYILNMNIFKMKIKFRNFAYLYLYHVSDSSNIK